MIQLKESVRTIEPYFVNDVEYVVKLDANEGSNYLLDEEILLNQIRANRYPDSDAKVLREKLAKYYGCKKENLLMGNGSSELIHMAINAFCEQGDRVLTFTPGFSMYDHYCQLCGAELIKLSTESDFSQDIDKLIARAKELHPKIVLLCNPNNPTGYVNGKTEIVKLLDCVKDSLILIDEAYGDFSDDSTVIPLIDQYENLVVLRTLSKAFGLANLRVGAIVANASMVLELWKVKAPYNLNGVSQALAEKALDHLDKVEAYISSVKTQREALAKGLSNLGIQTWKSGTNFILIRSEIPRLYEKLMQRGVLIRQFAGTMEGYYRITVGTKQENAIFMEKLKEVMENAEGRK